MLIVGIAVVLAVMAGTALGKASVTPRLGQYQGPNPTLTPAEGEVSTPLALKVVSLSHKRRGVELAFIMGADCRYNTGETASNLGFEWIGPKPIPIKNGRFSQTRKLSHVRVASGLGSGEEEFRISGKVSSPTKIVGTVSAVENLRFQPPVTTPAGQLTEGTCKTGTAHFSLAHK